MWEKIQFGLRFFVGMLFAACVAGVSTPAWAIGTIETPVGQRSVETGIGLISGWHCTGTLIEIEIDGSELVIAASGTPRLDTLETCGRSDTGFGVLMNFSRLDPAVKHELVAFADGEEFARVVFFTKNFGVPYLKDAPNAYCFVPNFPEVGTRTTLRWVEQKQNFSITSIDPSSISVTGVYYGAMSEMQGCSRPKIFRYATFHVEHDVDAGRISLRAEFDDGGECTFSAPVTRIEVGGSIHTRFGSTDDSEASCPRFTGDFFLNLSGGTIYGGNFSPCWAARLTGARGTL